MPIQNKKNMCLVRPLRPVVPPRFHLNSRDVKQMSNRQFFHARCNTNSNMDNDGHRHVFSLAHPVPRVSNTVVLPLSYTASNSDQIRVRRTVAGTFIPATFTGSHQRPHEASELHAQRPPQQRLILSQSSIWQHQAVEQLHNAGRLLEPTAIADASIESQHDISRVPVPTYSNRTNQNHTPLPLASIPINLYRAERATNMPHLESYDYNRDMLLHLHSVSLHLAVRFSIPFLLRARGVQHSNVDHVDGSSLHREMINNGSTNIDELSMSVCVLDSRQHNHMSQFRSSALGILSCASQHRKEQQQQQEKKKQQIHHEMQDQDQQEPQLQEMHNVDNVASSTVHHHQKNDCTVLSKLLNVKDVLPHQQMYLRCGASGFPLLTASHSHLSQTHLNPTIQERGQIQQKNLTATLAFPPRPSATSSYLESETESQPPGEQNYTCGRGCFPPLLEYDSKSSREVTEAKQQQETKQLSAPPGFIPLPTSSYDIIQQKTQLSHTRRQENWPGPHAVLPLSVSLSPLVKSQHKIQQQPELKDFFGRPGFPHLPTYQSTSFPKPRRCQQRDNPKICTVHLAFRQYQR